MKPNKQSSNFSDPVAKKKSGMTAKKMAEPRQKGVVEPKVSQKSKEEHDNKTQLKSHSSAVHNLSMKKLTSKKDLKPDSVLNFERSNSILKKQKIISSNTKINQRKIVPAVSKQPPEKKKVDSVPKPPPKTLVKGPTVPKPGETTFAFRRRQMKLNSTMKPRSRLRLQKVPSLSSCLIVKDQNNNVKRDFTGDSLQFDVLEASKSITSLKMLYDKNLEKKGIKRDLSPAKPFSAILMMVMIGLNAELMKKQQNSLIAGLRATNELNVQQDLQEDKAKENNVDKENDVEQKHEKPSHMITENKGLKCEKGQLNPYTQFEAEGARVRMKPKASTAIPRSDSVGSSSGRKYLAPTLSDPTRSDKEKAKNSKRNRAPVEGNDVQKVQQREVNSKPHPKVSSITVEVRDWWSEQIGHNSDSSEEE